MANAVIQRRRVSPGVPFEVPLAMSKNFQYIRAEHSHIDGFRLGGSLQVWQVTGLFGSSENARRFGGVAGNDGGEASAKVKKIIERIGKT